MTHLDPVSILGPDGAIARRLPHYEHRSEQLAMAAGDRHELLSDDYFVDLALWFNLAWIDPDDIRSDQRLIELADKGARFTREDVRYVIGRQRFMASGVPHLYHRLERDGQVEILTTPYYHPILPLIIDDRSALRSDPSALLPEVAFAYPDDAAFQREPGLLGLRLVKGDFERLRQIKGERRPRLLQGMFAGHRHPPGQ